jgi:hypothetical protein
MRPISYRIGYQGKPKINSVEIQWMVGWWVVVDHCGPQKPLFEGFRVSRHRLYQGVITLLELTISSVDI